MKKILKKWMDMMIDKNKILELEISNEIKQKALEFISKISCKIKEPTFICDTIHKYDKYSNPDPSI